MNILFGVLLLIAAIIIATAGTIISGEDAVDDGLVKDCQFSENTIFQRPCLDDAVLYCKKFCGFVKESDFCSRAERKKG